MTAREQLREWVRSRATSDDDTRLASRLVAAFVAEQIRADRKKRERGGAFESFASMAAALRSLR